MQTRLLCVTTTPAPGVEVPPPPSPASGAKFYTSSAGAVIDVPADYDSVDVQTLLSSRYFTLLGRSGPTTSRPTFPRVGELFIDTTVGAPVWYTGTDWRDYGGTSH